MRHLLHGVAAAMVVAMAAGCDRERDTEENVRSALDQADLRAIEVEVDQNAHTVHLLGTVDTLADRTRAGEVAAAVVGTSGRVVNELTVATLDEP